MARVKIGNVRTPIDYLKQFFAPAGYGLGKQGTPISDLDTATKCGWYEFGSGCIGAPFVYGVALVLNRYDLGIVQLVFDTAGNTWHENGAIVKRLYINDAWEEWEWFNPPMTPGVEYRTTERWMGKPVYTTLIDFDFTVEGTTSRMLPFGGQPIRYSASANGVVSPYHPGSGDGNNFEVYVDGIEITLTAGSAVVGKKVYVQLWYWK